MQVEFAEARIGMILQGVDEYGYGVEDVDLACLFVEVSELSDDLPASKHPVLQGKALKAIAGASVLGLSFVRTPQHSAPTVFASQAAFLTDRLHACVERHGDSAGIRAAAGDDRGRRASAGEGRSQPCWWQPQVAPEAVGGYPADVAHPDVAVRTAEPGHAGQP